MLAFISGGFLKWRYTWRTKIASQQPSGRVVRSACPSSTVTLVSSAAVTAAAISRSRSWLMSVLNTRLPFPSCRAISTVISPDPAPMSATDAPGERPSSSINLAASGSSSLCCAAAVKDANSRIPAAAAILFTALVMWIMCMSLETAASGSRSILRRIDGGRLSRMAATAAAPLDPAACAFYRLLAVS